MGDASAVASGTHTGINQTHIDAEVSYKYFKKKRKKKTTLKVASESTLSPATSTGAAIGDLTSALDNEGLHEEAIVIKNPKRDSIALTGIKDSIAAPRDRLIAGAEVPAQPKAVWGDAHGLQRATVRERDAFDEEAVGDGSEGAPISSSAGDGSLPGATESDAADGATSTSTRDRARSFKTSEVTACAVGWADAVRASHPRGDDAGATQLSAEGAGERTGSGATAAGAAKPCAVVVTPYSRSTVLAFLPEGKDGEFPPDLRGRVINMPAIRSRSGRIPPGIPRLRGRSHPAVRRRSTRVLSDSIMVFVDNSNTFIGAQLQRVDRGAGARHPTDRQGLRPRRTVRLDVRRLVLWVEARRAAATRCVACGNVGAASPIRAAWSDAGYHVLLGDVLHRREANVDDVLVNAAFAAARAEPTTDTGRLRTLVLVTGDGNDNEGRMSFFDVVRAALARGFAVELVTWHATASKRYEQLEKTHAELFSVRYLDDARGDVTFEEAELH